MSMKRGIEAASSEMSRPASIVVWSSENIRLSSLPQPGLRELFHCLILQISPRSNLKCVNGLRIRSHIGPPQDEPHRMSPFRFHP